VAAPDAAKAPANPAARCVTEVVKRAATKDSRGQNKTNCKHTVVCARPDRYGIRGGCLAIHELAASRHREKASELRYLRHSPAFSETVGGRGLVPGIRAGPPEYEEGLSQHMRTGCGVRPRRENAQPGRRSFRERRGCSTGPDRSKHVVAVPGDILELQRKAGAAAVRQWNAGQSPRWPRLGAAGALRDHDRTGMTSTCCPVTMTSWTPGLSAGVNNG
jgi:hypothetical protein